MVVTQFSMLCMKTMIGKMIKNHFENPNLNNEKEVQSGCLKCCIKAIIKKQMWEQGIWSNFVKN